MKEVEVPLLIQVTTLTLSVLVSRAGMVTATVAPLKVPELRRCTPPKAGHTRNMLLVPQLPDSKHPSQTLRPQLNTRKREGERRWT